jgi:hypothetical protein
MLMVTLYGKVMSNSRRRERNECSILAPCVVVVVAGGGGWWWRVVVAHTLKLFAVVSRAGF